MSQITMKAAKVARQVFNRCGNAPWGKLIIVQSDIDAANTQALTSKGYADADDEGKVSILVAWQQQSAVARWLSEHGVSVEVLTKANAYAKANVPRGMNAEQKADARGQYLALLGIEDVEGDEYDDEELDEEVEAVEFKAPAMAKTPAPAPLTVVLDDEMDWEQIAALAEVIEPEPEPEPVKPKPKLRSVKVQEAAIPGKADALKRLIDAGYTTAEAEKLLGNASF